MDKLRTLFCAGLLWLAAVCAGRGDDFAKAGQLYDEGRFEESRQLYREQAAHGPWSANLFYNLANAEYRTGELGRAALNYERAIALEGGHAEARANLHWLRETTGAKVPAEPWWEHLFPKLSENVWVILAAVFGWSALLAAALPAAGASSRWGLAVFALCLALYAGAGAWLGGRERAVAVITVKEAVARLAPADRAAPAETLPAGSRVRVLSERGEWVYCTLPDGRLGWVAAAQLEAIPLHQG